MMCKPGSVGDLGGQPPRSTRPISEDLVGVAALAGDQDRVARTGVAQGGLDGALAVGLNTDLSRTVEAAEQVVEDLVGGLGSRVTQREDDPVGPELRGLGQRPAGRSVLVSLGLGTQ